MEQIKPGIVVTDYYYDETTIYPTNFEWLLAFAIKGCKWAEDMIPIAIENARLSLAQDELGGNYD